MHTSSEQGVVIRAIRLSPEGDCFGGSVYVITASLPMSNWPYQIAYEWGALIKALFLYRAC